MYTSKFFLFQSPLDTPTLLTLHAYVLELRDTRQVNFAARITRT